MTRYLVGIDVGTTGVRCMIFGLAGEVVYKAYREYPSYFPAPGWVEHKPEELLGAVMEVCRQTMAESGVAPEEIAAIGFSTQRSVTCAVDAAGTPVRNLISWQDARCVEQVQDITAVIPGDDFYRVSGLPPSPMWLLPKILWMRKHEPALYEKTAKFVQVSDLVLRAFGADGWHTDTSCCVFYGLWDVKNACWNRDLMQQFGFSPDMFGTPTPAGTCVGAVTHAAAEKTGFAPGTPLCIGAGDQNCAPVGMGAIESGVGTITLGTCGLAILSTSTPVEGFGGMMIANHAVAGLWGIEGITNAAACAYKWFRENIGSGTVENTFAELNALAESSEVGANGVLFLPYLAGAASPSWNAAARGAMLGVSLSTTRADLVRAVMEGVVFEIYDIIQQWRRSGYTLQSVRIAGGATQSELWNHIQADVYGVPVQKLRCDESTCLGAAILGAVGAGVFADVAQACQTMVHPCESLEPKWENHLRYEERYAEFAEKSRKLFFDQDADNTER